MALVLIVDDSHDNASLVEASLTVLGYDVACAYTAEDGLDIAYQYHPDLIVADLRLYGSKIDGWEFIREVRAYGPLHDIPIIVTSVEVMPDDRPRALDAGANIYYPKPFRIAELRNHIKDWLG